MSIEEEKLIMKQSIRKSIDNLIFKGNIINGTIIEKTVDDTCFFDVYLQEPLKIEKIFLTIANDINISLL